MADQIEYQKLRWEYDWNPMGSTEREEFRGAVVRHLWVEGGVVHVEFEGGQRIKIDAHDKEFLYYRAWGADGKLDEG